MYIYIYINIYIYIYKYIYIYTKPIQQKRPAKETSKRHLQKSHSKRHISGAQIVAKNAQAIWQKRHVQMRGVHMSKKKCQRGTQILDNTQNNKRKPQKRPAKKTIKKRERVCVCVCVCVCVSSCVPVEQSLGLYPKRPAKETCKRDLYKTPVKETCQKSYLKRHISATFVVGICLRHCLQICVHVPL